MLLGVMWSSISMLTWSILFHCLPTNFFLLSVKNYDAKNYFCEYWHLVCIVVADRNSAPCFLVGSRGKRTSAFCVCVECSGKSEIARRIVYCAYCGIGNRYVL